MGLFDDPLANCEPSNQWHGCPNCARLESSNADLLAALEKIVANEGDVHGKDTEHCTLCTARAAVEAEKARSK